jgi:hypothetical protein
MGVGMFLSSSGRGWILKLRKKILQKEVKKLLQGIKISITFARAFSQPG